MEAHDLTGRNDGFTVLASTRRSQAAVMTLSPGESTGTRDGTDHPRSDQWLYVLSGEGEALGESQRLALSPGVLLMIPAGEGHAIRCTGPAPLRTLNLYAPSAYGAD